MSHLACRAARKHVLRASSFILDKSACRSFSANQATCLFAACRAEFISLNLRIREPLISAVQAAKKRLDVASPFSAMEGEAHADDAVAVMFAWRRMLALGGRAGVVQQ